ncbi:MAG: hypothetical protein ACR2MD_18525 [Aridibacter sp.]|jgi:hypothetical protein|nr:hypothetical protein [Acidobacteriota bacterium]
MGQITIEIPQKTSKTYRIVSEDSAKRIISNIEIEVTKENSVEDDEILGLWADRDETVEEIAMDLRSKSNNRSLEK